MNNEIVIVSATRTALGSFGGSLSSIPAHKLGSAVIASLLEKTGVANDQIDEVILGQVLTAGSGQNPARQAAIDAGLSNMIPAMTINKVCTHLTRCVYARSQRERDIYIPAHAAHSPPLLAWSSAPNTNPQPRHF